jgi:hypothetical protein
MRNNLNDVMYELEGSIGIKSFAYVSKECSELF